MFCIFPGAAGFGINSQRFGNGRRQQLHKAGAAAKEGGFFEKFSAGVHSFFKVVILSTLMPDKSNG
jgi:hypothetical protein